MEPFIEIKNVCKTYGKYKVLNNISLNVPKQSIYGLLGPNGAGKTTLIRILNQITAPDQGSILFNGEVINQKHIAKIGYLPEERGLYKKMKVGEQAIYLAQLKGLDKNTAKKNLKKQFEKFDIGPWWNKKVEELSKGMQQKVQFIVTVIHEPELLIFDEPFSGFDPINANLLKNEILNLREKGATILFSTHDMASVEEICDNIMLINKGEKILEGSVYDIKQRFKDYTFEIAIRLNGKELLLPEGFNILSQKTDKNNETRLKIKVGQDKDANILIKILIEKGSLISYHEILPSMNNIFIRQIEERNKSDKQN